MKPPPLNTVSVMFVVMLLLAAAPRAARAALGEPAASVEVDRKQMIGRLSTRGTTPGTGVTIEEISTPAGTSIREYVSPGGIVFAVSWQGPAPPDLSTLLGSYFADYQKAAASSNARQGLHHSIIRTANVVVETGGHMRALWGRAFVPGLLPAGVDETEIR